MLVISLLFIALVILLIFCLTKDTGDNTIYARKNAERPIKSASQELPSRRASDSVNIYEVS